MKIELLVDCRNGEIFDISELISTVSWKTSRKDRPGSLEFSYNKDSTINISNGNVVSLKVNGVGVFYGYVFDLSGSREPLVKVTCYDSKRYLLFDDTVVETGKKASYIISKYLKSLGLKVGTIEDTKYVMPTFLEDGKKMLDIFQSALDKTVMSTKQTYVLYDDYGTIHLRNINNLKTDRVISVDSNLGDYDWKKSIDGETYNRVKLVKDDEKSKKRDVYIVQDSKNIAKWGRLQYFKKVEDNMNKAQITELANNILAVKNCEERTLKLKEVISYDINGDLKLRGGMGIYVDIKELKTAQYYLIEETTHTIQNSKMTIDFDLKVV
ncbi:MAG: hypothetical protein RR782_02695 [Clostridium sp.]